MISVDYLKSRFTYEPHSGRIFNKSGKQCFLTEHDKGYFVGGIDYKIYKAHRVAWAIQYGEWPDGFVDHINGDGKDNRIDNLRLATRGQNQHNRKINANSTTGYKCVLKTRYGKFYVQINVDGVRRRFGNFLTAQEAHEVYLQKMNEYHGEYGRSE